MKTATVAGCFVAGLLLAILLCSIFPEWVTEVIELAKQTAADPIGFKVAEFAFRLGNLVGAG